MAWLSKITWHDDALPKPSGQDLDNYGLDIRTWGGNVDAGGYNLTNVGVLTFTTLGGNVAGNAKNIVNLGGVGIGIASPLRPLHLAGAGWPEFLFEATDATNEVGRVWGFSLNSGATHELTIRAANANLSATQGVIAFRSDGKITMLALPTSSAGLTSGMLWIDTAAGRVIKVVA